MNNAIGYIRISTKDQSNFSLDAQEDHVRSYAKTCHYNLLELFIDNGQSAKSFDRTEWKKLEAFVREHYKNVNFLIVPKFDRFSRNVSEALNMIELLENKFRIRVISVFEPIHLPIHSPYYFQFRTNLLMNAQVERMVIIERTRMGLNQASKKGLIVNNAPFGYVNARNEKNQPTVAIDPKRAEMVKLVYQLFINGVGYREIQLHLHHRHGEKLPGHSTMKRILTNPVYAGLVRVPAFQEQPEHFVKGIHEPIIPEDTWLRVQQMMKPGTRTRKVLSEDFPLRGAISCHCGRPLTAAFSKGKTTKVGYYWCHTHRSVNLRAAAMHEQFEELLQELSLPDKYIQTLMDLTDQGMKDAVKEADERIAEKQKELSLVIGKQERLQEQLLEGGVFTREEYNKWNIRLHQERSIIENELNELRYPVEMIWETYRTSLPKLGNLKYLFQMADLPQKNAMINAVFDNKLYYQNGTYRTPFLLDIFRPKAASLQEKKLLVVEQLLEENSLIQRLYPNGDIQRTLNNFLSIIAGIRVA